MRPPLPAIVIALAFCTGCAMFQRPSPYDESAPGPKPSAAAPVSEETEGMSGLPEAAVAASSAPVAVPVVASTPVMTAPVVAAAPAGPLPTHYKVYIWQENGDCLWRIAEKVYGDRNKWPLLYLANRDRISDPNKIYPKQKLRIPPPDWQPN